MYVHIIFLKIYYFQYKYILMKLFIIKQISIKYWYIYFIFWNFTSLPYVKSEISQKLSFPEKGKQLFLGKKKTANYWLIK